MKPIIFLDVDGVLNGHEWSYLGGRRTMPGCVAVANRIFAEADAVAVLISSWRGLVHNGQMTFGGLCTLLATHGCEFLLADLLPGVEHTPEAKTRGVLEWVRQHQLDRWLAIDDAALQLPAGRHLRPDHHRGLEPFHVKRCVELWAAQTPPG